MNHDINSGTYFIDKKNHEIISIKLSQFKDGLYNGQNWANPPRKKIRKSKIDK